MIAGDTIDSSPPRAGRREWIGLGAIALACMLYVMDLTILHLAIPEISSDLQPSSTQQRLALAGLLGRQIGDD